MYRKFTTRENVMYNIKHTRKQLPAFRVENEIYSSDR